MDRTLIQLSVALLVGFGALQQGRAEAAIITFRGGECTVLDARAAGITLESCVNRTKRTVNDLHLIFSHPDLPNVTRDYSFDDVASGGTWTPSGGFDVIWNRVDAGQANFNFNTLVLLEGSTWTFDGKSVPEPATVSLMFAGLVGAMSARRYCRKRVSA